MVRRFAVLGVVVVVASAAAAQTPPAPTPAAACRMVGSAYQTQAIQTERAANRTPDATTIIAESKRRTRACAETLSTTKGTVAELTGLSALYLYVGDTAGAKSIVATLLTRNDQTERDRADVMLAGITLENAALDPFAGINERSEALVRSIDAMSNAVIQKKISAHQSMLGRYEYADIDEGIRHHGQQLLALAREALRTNALPTNPARPAQGNRAATPEYNQAYSVMLSAYSGLARAAGDYLHADSALLILDEADRVVSPNLYYARESIERDRKMYRLIGTKATPVNGKWWVNAADGTVIKPGDGKISIVQFTAHWCVPCKKSYPPMLRLMAKYKGKPVESVMATGIYGYLGDNKNLTPEQEVEANRDYYSVHHGLPFQIAINPADSRALDDRYSVGGIPQIVIIDRKGVIRATVVGWDVGNEARFAAFIDKLLAEK